MNLLGVSADTTTTKEECLSLIQAEHESASANMASTSHDTVLDSNQPRCPLQYPLQAFIDTLHTLSNISLHELFHHRRKKKKSISVGVCYKYRTQCEESRHNSLKPHGFETESEMYR